MTTDVGNPNADAATPTKPKWLTLARVGQFLGIVAGVVVVVGGFFGGVIYLTEIQKDAVDRGFESVEKSFKATERKLDDVKEHLNDRINSVTDTVDRMNGNLVDRMNVVDSHLTDKIDTVNTNLDQRLDQVDGRFDRMESRLGARSIDDAGDYVVEPEAGSTVVAVDASASRPPPKSN